MIKHIGHAALVLALVTFGPSPKAHAKSHAVFKGSAQWTVNAPDLPACGKFSTLLVHSTAADDDIVEVIYQAGNTCDNTFQSLQGSGTATLSGNLKLLTIEGTIPTSGGPVDVDITLKRTKDLSENGPDEKVVSARAKGTVILGGQDLTDHAPTTDATITKTKSKS
jgi:hypothetical protein